MRIHMRGDGDAQAERASLRTDAGARFDAAVARPPEEGAAPGHGGIVRDLAGAAVVGARRILPSTNVVFLLELEGGDPFDPERGLRAIYKPAAGERPLWDFPDGTLHLREAAAYAVDSAAGFGLVPPTILRDGPYGPGSVQLFVDVVGRELTAAEEAALTPSLTTLAALDALLNNADRKSAHLLVSGQGLRAIDNALSFLPYPRQRTVLLELGGSPIPEAAASAIAALAGDARRRAALLGHLRRLLAESEVVAFAARLDLLAERPVYPELDPWDGRPFEMW